MGDDVKIIYQEEFEYLDMLRESGETNMWGASTYLKSEFGMDGKSARSILGLWMDTFEERHEGAQLRWQSNRLLSDGPKVRVLSSPLKTWRDYMLDREIGELEKAIGQLIFWAVAFGTLLGIIYIWG